MLRSRPTLALLAAAAAVAASSCRDATSPSVTAEGVWSSAELAGLTYSYAPVFDLVETPSGEIGGTVTVLWHPNGSLHIRAAVTGQQRGSNVTLSWDIEECHCVFHGTVSAGSIHGTLTSAHGTLPQTLVPGLPDVMTRPRAGGTWMGESLAGTAYLGPVIVIHESPSGDITGHVSYGEPTRSAPVDDDTDDLKGKQTGATVVLDWTLKGNWHYEATVTLDSLYGTISNGQSTHRQSLSNVVHDPVTSLVQRTRRQGTYPQKHDRWSWRQ
jgi:hypothetical protein